jgi:spore maturation protein SpmA
MIMFLVLNTAGITLIPTSVIAIRQSMAVKQGLVGFNAADIFLPTLLGTFISFCAGLVAVAWQRINLWQRRCWPSSRLRGADGAGSGPGSACRPSRWRR